MFRANIYGPLDREWS